MSTPASPVALLPTPRPGAILPLSCRRGVPVVSNGAVVGTVADLISGDWIRVRWTNGMVSEVHGSRIDDAPTVTAPPTNSAIEAHLSALGGGPVRIFERRGEGLVLTGWTTELARLCGFKASGRVYFTASNVRALLAARAS